MSRYSGYAALTETNTNLNRLDGSRLPSTCSTASFFVVFDGCAKLLADDQELAEDLAKSEAAVRAWAASRVTEDNPLDQVLLTETLLYVVADKHARPANATPPTDGAVEAETSETGGKKKKKKQ